MIRTTPAAHLLRFAAIGLVGTAAHYAALLALVHHAAVPPTAATSAGAVLGAIVNWWLNRRLNYRSSAPARAEAMRFGAVAATSVLLNGAVFASVRPWLGGNVLAAQLVATATTLLWNFVLNHRWTFAAARRARP